jgi:hypothetical protein
LLQRFIKSFSLAVHRCQNEIAGAVDNAGNPFDVIARQAFAERFDDRDATTHRSFKSHHHAFLMGFLKNIVAMMGQERFIRRHDLFAIFHGSLDPGAGRLNPACKFNHDVNVWIVDDLEGVGRQGNADFSGFAKVADTRFGDGDVAASAPCDFQPVGRKDFDNTLADCTEP